MAANVPVLGNLAKFKFGANYIDSDGNQIKMSVSQDTHDVSEFGATWKAFIAGLASAEIAFTGYYDIAANQVDATIFTTSTLGAPTTSSAFEVGPVSNVAGQNKYTGNCWVSKYDTDSKPNAAVVVTASFRVTGAITRASY